MSKEQKKQRCFINLAGFILALTAGWVDTLGVYVFLGENSPFLTGRVVKLGKYLINREAGKALAVMLLLVAFITGAILSSLLTRKKGLAGGLALAGLFLLLTPFLAGLKSSWTLLTIPLAMGAQNAATSLTAINRTTHLTGPTTDIGISIAYGNWQAAGFWSLRWLAFFLGVVSSYLLVRHYQDQKQLACLILLPGLIILLTALWQWQGWRIPLNDLNRKDSLP